MIGGRLNVLTAIQPGPAFYIALHDCPEDRPRPENEIHYRGYMRVVVPRTKAGWLTVDGETKNVNDLFWPRIRQGNYVAATDIALWNQREGGQLVAFLRCEDAPVIWLYGQQPTIERGQLVISVPSGPGKAVSKATLKGV